MADLATGSIFAGHRIEGVVGRGGMGVVYLATHLALDRRVALKLIAPELAEEPGFRERFRRESRIAASIDHPHVIAVHHAGEEDGVLFITMRYIEGEDLGGVIKREGRLEPGRAARIVSQVAEALDAAHEHGLVHRDVKPANILLADQGGRDHVYLTDFGLTKRDTSVASITDTGQIVGTLDYVAPEQIRGEAVDARTDVYALGCVLFHALTGEVPFQADTYAGKVFSHLTEDAPSLTARVPRASPALEAVVHRAMEKQPADRYATAGALGTAALEAVSGDRPTDVRRTVPAETAPRSLPPEQATVTLDQPAPTPVAPTQAGISVAEPPRRRWGVLAAVAAVVVVAAAAGLLLARGLGGGVSRAEAIATLDRYQVSLTNADLPALEKLLAPGFERKLLADPPGDRATALKAFRAAFDVRGTQPRFSLKDVRVETADGGATATARYSYTAGGDPHPGDYGANTFHMVERDGKVLIDRIETYPDVVALLPPSLKSSDFPLEVSLTATLAVRGESVPIAKATSRLERRPDAVVVPLTKTGRRIVHSGQDYEVHMKLTLADGRPLTVATTTNHFISGAGPGQP